SPADHDLYFSRYLPHPALHSFPTRRSSDLAVHQLILCGVSNPSYGKEKLDREKRPPRQADQADDATAGAAQGDRPRPRCGAGGRSEEHTSELQSRGHLECRLLLEKKKKPAE